MTMSKKAKPATSNRREFLKGVAVMGGTAALALVSQAQASEVAPDVAKQDVATPESKGYRVTPHVAEYYNKARF